MKTRRKYLEMAYIWSIDLLQ